MIEEILPAGVRCAEEFADLPDAPLYAEEETVVARAVPERRRQFATARACARRALGELGIPPVAVPRGAHGEPRWPAGVVGSITHCDGYRAAVVARSDRLASVGVDAEPAQPLPGRVLDLISLPAERDLLAALARTAPSGCWDRLLFCAKEAVYKAWYPLAGRWLGFTDALVTIHPDGTFTARLLVPGPRLADRVVDGFAGRWLARDGLLLTAIAETAAGG